MKSQCFVIEEINKETGEVSKRVEKSKWASEPPYIKLYLQSICLLKKVPQSSNGILLSLLSRISYADTRSKYGGQVVYVNAGMKREIAEENDLSVDSVNKALTAFVKSGLFARMDTGVYQANPELFGKGDWKDVSLITATIGFSSKGITTDIKFKTA